jgi:hypothetical protein
MIVLSYRMRFNRIVTDCHDVGYYILSRSKYFVKACFIIFALFFVSACSTEEKEPPSRQFFEEHFLGNLHLGSNETQFKEKFGSAICRQFPHVNSPYSHWSHSKCNPNPNKAAAVHISIPGAGKVSVTHYEAEFFYKRMESMIYQFIRKDYSRVYKGLEDILGKPLKESSKRISGSLGPTVNKNKTAIWKLPDYSIKLQSKPAGGSISLMQFYTNTYPLRLKETFEKQLKNSAVSTHNRKHYENWIKIIETDY